METIQTICSMMQKNDYLTSIDLKDAFLHILIHPDYRRYLQFNWKGLTYQFRTLPFGLSLSPLVFTKILRPVIKWARRKGIRLSIYLDDLLIMAKTKELSYHLTQQVLHKLRDLGFMTNPDKSHLEPTQTLDHLGLTINTKTMTLSVPKTKIRNIRREAQKIVNKGSTSLRNLASFIGKALATTAAIFPARLMTRQLVALKNAAMTRPGTTWNSTVFINAAAAANLQWWITQLKTWNGTSWVQSKTQLDIYTDASDQGWGIVIGHQSWSGTWSETERQKHINWKELQTVLLAVRMNQSQGKMVNIICDNMTTISYINKFGGTRSPSLMELADKVWQHCCNK